MFTTQAQSLARLKRIITAAVVAFGVLAFGAFSAIAVTSIGTDISTGGNLSVTGTVGIGTASPNSELDVRDSSPAPTTNILQVANLNDSNRYFTVSSTSTLVAGGTNFGIGNAAPSSRLTVGSTTSTFEVNSSGNLVKINNIVYSWPALQGGTSTFLQNNGSGTLTWVSSNGLVNLNQAYLNSTSSAEISLSGSLGAVTIADTFSGTGNVFEIQDRTNAAGDFSTRYFTVSSTTTMVAKLTIGSDGTLITNHLSGTAANMTSASIAGVSCGNYGTITVTGAATGDTVYASPDAASSATGIEDSALMWNAVVTSSNTVTIRACNPTALAVDAGDDQEWRADVWKH